MIKLIFRSDKIAFNNQFSFRKKSHSFQIIRHAYLNDDAGFESSLRSLTLEGSASSSKLTCWKLVGCAQQTARKPLHVPCTTP